MTPETLIARHAETLADLVYAPPAVTLPELIEQIEAAEDEWQHSEAGAHFTASQALLQQAGTAITDQQLALLESADEQLTSAIAEAG